MPSRLAPVPQLHKWYLVLGVLLGLSACGSAAEQVLATGPLTVGVNDDLSTQVCRLEGSSTDPQYYSTYQTYLIVTKPGNVITNYSSQDADFGLVSNSNAGSTINTAVTAESGNISITHALTYNANTQVIVHLWTITNSPNSGVTYANLSLRYGGDTKFQGDDNGIGFSVPFHGSQLVFCTNPAFTGLMGMTADVSSPASHFSEDLLTVLVPALDLPSAANPTASTLNDSANPSLVDNATGLEWDIPNLAPGASATVRAYEQWDDPLSLSMPAMATPSSTFCSATTTATCSITNHQAIADAISLQTITTPGISVLSFTANGQPVSGAISVPVNGSLALQLTYSGASSLANDQGYVGILALSGNSNGILQQSGAQISFVPAIVVAPTPAQQAVFAGEPLALSFQVTNNQATADTFDLTLQESPGISITGLSLPLQPITLAAGASQTITMTATADASLANQRGSVFLTAISQANSAFNTQGIALMDVSLAATVQAPTVTGSQSTGSPLNATFTITNLETGNDAFNLGVSASSGISITGVQVQGALSTSGSLATIAGQGSAQATVSFVASSSIAGSNGTITLLASSTNAPGASAQAAVNLTFASLGVVPPPPVTPVAAPSLPISSPSQVFYVPICPSTPQGVSDVLSVFNTAGAANAVAYAWDSLAQSYTLLPTQPAGGLVDTGGIFIASVVALPLDFSGTASQFPLSISLHPGWNLIGIPPMDPGSSSPVISTHPFPSGFNLLDGSGAVILDQATFINSIGTVGSNSLASCDPYLFNNPGYTQVGSLQSGIAYWIKDNAATSLTLQRVLSGVTLSARHAGSPAPKSAGGSYTDRGTPPAPPSKNADSASGGRCGAGAAGVIVLLPLAVLLRRRKRTDAR